MTIRSFPAIFNQTVGQPSAPKMPLRNAVAFAAGLGLSMLSYPLHAAPAGGGDTVRGLYDALLSTMKNGRILGQSGRFTQLQPVIRRSFDITSMARCRSALLGWFDRGAASADDRELWTLHLGYVR
jgi:hypothetical protein